MRPSTIVSTAATILLSVALTACAVHKKPDLTPKTESIDKITKLEGQLQSLKEQNSVLKTKLSEKAGSKARAGHATVESAYATVGQVPADTAIPTGEHSLYTAAIEAYWAKDLSKLERLASMFAKTYPSSAYADNILFLHGSLLTSQGNFSEGLKVLNLVETKYPNGNKVVSAQFLKAYIYTRLNLNEQAQDLYRRISKTYPGSPEATQSALQLKQASKREVLKR